MPRFEPHEIISVVDKMEGNRSLLHRRMDSDFDRYILVPYRGEVDEEGKAILDGYKKFTSNDPGTTMDLALHLLSSARRIVRVHQGRSMPEERKLDNSKELFCLGLLEAIDERRTRLLQPRLQDSLSGQSLIRGRRAQRVLLVREPITEDNLTAEQRFERREMESLGFATPPLTRTYADVTDWDPRNTYWEIGRNGLNWACHKVMKTRSEIIAEYGVDPQEEASGPNQLDAAMDDRPFDVYDWFDDKENQVVLEGGQVLKAPTRHGMRRVPIEIGISGRLPLFQAPGKDYDANYGESFYKNARAIFDQQNFMYSILAELSKRSIKQPLAVSSRDGTLTLKDDPRIAGSETSLSTENEESIVPLPPMEMVQASGAFMGIISGMAQRSTFSFAQFGELAFQLSGIAIAQLRQGMEAPLTPHLTGCKSSEKGILDILCDAYAGGEFDTMTLSGRSQDPQRKYFSQEFTPELIREGGVIEIDWVPTLPQDDATKAALVQMLRDGPVPIADDRFLREKILQIQDVDQMESAIWEQLARRGSPMALAFNSMIAAAEQGDQELSELWFSELELVMIKAMMEKQMLGQTGAGPNGAAGANGGNGQAPQAGLPRPQVVPPQMLGRRNAPTFRAGPLVAPGTPRPGAQRPELRDFGLMGEIG